MGYLASQEKLDEAALRRAMIFGSVMASFNVEEFGTERVQRLTPDEINQRFRAFKRFTHFEEIPFERKVSGARFQVSGRTAWCGAPDTRQLTPDTCSKRGVAQPG